MDVTSVYPLKLHFKCELAPIGCDLKVT